MEPTTELHEHGPGCSTDCGPDRVRRHAAVKAVLTRKADLRARYGDDAEWIDNENGDEPYDEDA